MNRVFDASALLTYLRGEDGCTDVAAILLDSNNHCFCHYLNALEVYQRYAREKSADAQLKAEKAISTIVDLGVQIEADFEENLRDHARELSCSHHMSIADSFGLAYSHKKSADFVTRDWHELEAVAIAGVCNITLIGPCPPPKDQEERETQRAKGAIDRLGRLEKLGMTKRDWRTVLREALDD